MDLLGRYYTNDIFSHLLISKFKQKYPNSVVDLGIGEGALLRAAHKRWENANFFATEIDSTKFDYIKKDLPFVNIEIIDGLSSKCQFSHINIGNVDIAVCNPPYLPIKDKANYNSLFNSAGFGEWQVLRKVTADIVFLAQNIRMLKEGGELGIILPDSILTGKEFKLVRQSLLLKHRIISVIQLPDKTFAKTEARTHILIIEKNKSPRTKVPLFKATNDGFCIDKIDVSTNNLINRMDHHYYKWFSCQPTFNGITLEELGADIKRGQFTLKELNLFNTSFFHTTSFPKNFNKVRFGKLNISPHANMVTAKSGDILLARVGRGCIGYVTRMTGGETLISDCVYRIRIKNKKYQDAVWNSLISKRGQDWLKANAHGVCAKVISKQDLMNFSIVSLK